MVEIHEHVRLSMTRRDGMTFNVHPDNGDYEIIVDKEHHDYIDVLGPTPTRLLAMGLLGCLTSSLLACLQKKELDVDDLESIAEYDMIKDDNGFVRVREIKVTIKTASRSEKVRKRLSLCKKFFEEQCTVTTALRDGINVKVEYEHS